MKLKLIPLLFLLKLVPSMAQEGANSTAKDTIPLKQVEVDASTTAVLSEQKVLDIQKTIIENQKETERIKAKAEADAKDLEKEEN